MADPAHTNQALLDEDDDFVEFETDDWSQRQANFAAKDLWDAAWDVDKPGGGMDAVAQQIRTQLDKKAAAAAAAGQQQQQPPAKR